jgi:CubicO group peptidase (beta-lactamase class C family)
VYEYSNMATALEGYLVERISGIPFNQYCNQNIFIPLGMNNTHWYLSEYSNSNMLANPHYYYDSQFVPIDNYGFADYPDGMLHTNVKDLANFMIAIFQSGVFNNNTILSPETLSDMFTSQIPAIEPTQGLQFYQETFNVSTGNVTLWGHSGGEYGISTEMYFDFTENMGIAVLANGENGTRHIFEELYDYGLTLSPSGAPNLGKESDTQKKIVLNDVFPNPFNSSAQISYSLPKNAFVRLRIFDLLGREIVTLVNQKQPSGNYTVKFDASKLSSGIYFCRLRVADFAVTKKIILLR